MGRDIEGLSIVVAQNDKFYGSSIGVELDVEISGLQATVVHRSHQGSP